MDNSTENYNCPNCQTTLIGISEFCHNCGQKRIYPEDHSVWHLVVESLGDFFHFESKFFTTLRPLFFRPGFLTNEYLQGKRARYFQPFKLFLFISFLYFLTSGLMIHRDSDTDKKVSAIKKEVDSTVIVKDPGTFKLHIGRASEEVLAMSDDSLRKMVKIYGLNRFVNQKYPKTSWFLRFLQKQVIKNRLQGSATFVENIQKTIPKLIFILIPFIALLLKLLYIRKKIPYFNHIIFSLHFLSFVFLLLWIRMFGSLIMSWFEMVVYILILVYLYFAMLRVYRQKYGVTFRKLILLFFGSLFMLAVFFIIAASISFMMV
jgi:hypothetical protein